MGGIFSSEEKKLEPPARPSTSFVHNPYSGNTLSSRPTPSVSVLNSRSSQSSNSLIKVHRVQNFSHQSTQAKYSISCSHFEWSVTIIPQGSSPANKEYVFFHVNRASANLAKNDYTCRVSLESEYDQTIEVRALPNTSSSDHLYYIKRNQLLWDIRPHDSFTITVEIELIPKTTSTARNTVQQSKCSSCYESVDLWKCASCGQIGCGRNKAKHALEHFHQTSHKIAYGLNDGRTHDYTGEELKCVSCNETGDLWKCAYCEHIGCGRNVNKHALGHFHRTSHRLARGINDNRSYGLHDYNGEEHTKPTSTLASRPAASIASPAIRAAPAASIETMFSRLSVSDTLKKFQAIDEDDLYTGCVPVYTLSVTDERVVVFEPAREKFIESSRVHLGIRNILKDDVYHCSGIAQDRLGSFSVPPVLNSKLYLERGTCTFSSVNTYREMILPALLLGSRVRDFEQRCATVDQIGTVVLIIPAQNRKLKTLKLKTTEGNTFEIDVKFVKKGKEEDLDKKWTVICHPPKAPLPLEVVKNAHLEMMDMNPPQPRVTNALMKTYANKKAPISNWGLLSAIYGTSARRVFPAPPYVNPQIRLAKLAGSVGLNPEQAEAVGRYNCDAVPAFVVESPPGSGKTMTAAAMAVSYTGDGVQLFLSTANVPVINMALALSKLDYSGLRPLHFISSEREELMTDETRSPFSVLSLAMEREELKEKIRVLEEQLKHAPNFEEKDKLKGQIKKVCGPIYNDDYNVFFATVDMILGRLFKGKPDGKPDAMKRKLMNDVRRIVVDEASQLTESALNALILCFPQAQIVLIGDSKQLPPFKYEAGDVVSELAARSALEVVKDKMNLPVIKLTRVYRASPRLAAHYSDVFYGGGLQSCKAEVAKNVLDCFGARSRGCRLLFWKVKGWQKQSGTSKVNDSELVSLKYLVNMLRLNGYDEKSVMIISYYEAQRKRAEEHLEEKYGEGYEVLTVDSAQGREKKIVIVMTTRTSVPTDKGAFFSCPLRCNVAVSRHQEALIVLGHQSIASAPNWARVLNQKYFRTVEDQKK